MVSALIIADICLALHDKLSIQTWEGSSASLRMRFEWGGDLSPVPFPQGKECLLVGMRLHGLAGISDGKVSNSRPFRGGLGRGF